MCKPALVHVSKCQWLCLGSDSVCSVGSCELCLPLEALCAPCHCGICCNLALPKTVQAPSMQTYSNLHDWSLTVQIIFKRKVCIVWANLADFLNSSSSKRLSSAGHLCNATWSGRIEDMWVRILVVPFHFMNCPANWHQTHKTAFWIEEASAQFWWAKWSFVVNKSKREACPGFSNHFRVQLASCVLLSRQNAQITCDNRDRKMIGHLFSLQQH